MIFRLKWGYFGSEKNVCPLETSIQILSLTDLLIPADGQIKVDICHILPDQLDLVH